MSEELLEASPYIALRCCICSAFEGKNFVSDKLSPSETVLSVVLESKHLVVLKGSPGRSSKHSQSQMNENAQYSIPNPFKPLS